MPLPVFIESLVKDKNVASVMPTRSRCVRRFLSDLQLPPNSRIIEYGPGTGAFTRALLSSLGPSGELFAFETNALMVDHLRSNLQDERLNIIQDQAQNAPKILKELKRDGADVVLSGIPLSFLDQPSRKELFSSTLEILKPKGTFLIYQSAWTPFKQDAEILHELKEYFSLAKREFFWWNVPPLVSLFFRPKPYRNQAIL